MNTTILHALQRRFFLSAVFISGAFASGAERPATTNLPFQRIQLSDKFFSEGASFGDLNHDGVPDAVAGPYWYEGPDFTRRHELFPPETFDPVKYSDNFFAFVHDFNGDGWGDVLVLGFPGVDASWYENPAQAGGKWRRHVVFLPVDGESPTFGDLFANGHPVLICGQRGQLGYATSDPKNPATPWSFHPISALRTWQRFSHGLGFGDINGDGRPDLMDKDGWWEQPASLKGDPEWVRHLFPFSPGRGGAQMYAIDVTGDGLADVIAVRNAHGYGLSWFEQKRAGDGAISFVEHRILSEQAGERLGGVQFSQAHAIALADVDGDGLPDIITGKRWWSHGPKGDVDPNGTPVLYAFLLRRGPNHTASFEPDLIDSASGVGTQVVATDVNGDGRADIVVGNKRGTFLFLSQKAPAKN